MNLQQLRSDLLDGQTGDLQRRRAMIGLSLTGIAGMAAVTLLQMGILKHLPDPPLKAFDSDKVNLSDTAYQFGVPDGTIGLASFAANLPLVAFGGANRAQEQPWAPLLFGAKATVDALISAWYFYQMPAKEKAWCGYCVTGALASFAICALSLPEARKALATLRGG